MMPVSVFVAVMVTPGTNAPVESATLPPSVELLVCASAGVPTQRHAAMTAAKRFLMIHPPVVGSQ
jgi:hypothetical protein